jgi:hypothetical protein
MRQHVLKAITEKNKKRKREMYATSSTFCGIGGAFV